MTNKEKKVDIHNVLPLCPKVYEDEVFEAHLQKVFKAIKENIPSIGDRQPRLGTQDYKWTYCAPWDWVSSFYVGQLWLAYKVTADPVFKNAADLQTPYFKNLVDLKFAHSHDVGFVYSLSAVADYKINDNEKARQMALSAADSLLARFKRVGKYFVAWNETHMLGAERTQGKVIIDSIQNMNLLFWATEQTGNQLYRECAIAHANTMAKTIVREDYTVSHTYNFDPLTQQPIGPENFQGYADNSCWARGLSWAIHGFAQIYNYTKDPRHLEIAKEMAKYAAVQLINDPVPIWDYLLPEHETPHRDSSAGSCTAAGLFIIAGHCDDAEEAEQYRQWGRYLIKGLMDRCDLTENKEALGLLDEGAQFVHNKLVNNMLPYGDYYYVEALMRANGYTKFFW